MSSGRACVSTWMVTSSGIRSRSMISRTKSKSVCEAAGKPTSISLKPMLTSMSNMRRLRAGSMGSISAWLPSRRSTLHQVGGAAMTALGQVRSVRSMGAKARYLLDGLRNMMVSLVQPVYPLEIPRRKRRGLSERDWFSVLWAPTDSACE